METNELKNMTKKRMEKLVKSGDPKKAHMEADMLLCEVVRKLGRNDIADLYVRIKKEY